MGGGLDEGREIGRWCMIPGGAEVDAGRQAGGGEEDKIVNDRRMKYNYYNSKLVCGRIAAPQGTKEAKVRRRVILSGEELAPVWQGCRYWA